MIDEEGLPVRANITTIITENNTLGMFREGGTQNVRTGIVVEVIVGYEGPNNSNRYVKEVATVDDAHARSKREYDEVKNRTVSQVRAKAIENYKRLQSEIKFK